MADALRHVASRHHARGDYGHAGEQRPPAWSVTPTLDGDASRQRECKVPDVFAGADRNSAAGIVRPARAMSGRQVAALVERGRRNQSIGTGATPVKLKPPAASVIALRPSMRAPSRFRPDEWLSMTGAVTSTMTAP